MKYPTHLLLLAAVFAGALAAAAHGQLQPPPVVAPWIGYPTNFYPKGLYPTDGQLVDLDGDGHEDLVSVGAATTAQLSILFGDGFGGFGAPDFTDLAQPSRAVADVDLDGDGDQDLVVADTGVGFGQTTVSVYSNQGDGTFAPPVQWPIGGGATGLAVADIDGDGNLDIAGALPQAVGLILGNGDGTFQAPLSFVVTLTAKDLAAGDLDGDGDTDLVVAHNSKKISVLENIGVGFAAPVPYDSIPGGYFNDDANVHLADVDKDGDLDALYSSESTGQSSGGLGYGAVALFRNVGGAVFGAPETIPLDPSAGGASDIEVADLTGDGWPDLVAAPNSGLVCLVPGDGAGGFTAAVSHRSCGDAVEVELGDLDGDSDLDIVIIGGGSMEACVLKNLGQGTFASLGFDGMIDASVAPASSSRLLADDIDLDGDVDLVVGYSENWNSLYGISVRRNQGDGTLAPAELYSTPQFPEWMAIGDLNGDLYPDLVWLDGWGAWFAEIRFKLNLGNGSFGVTTSLPGTWCEQDARVLLEDMNADGMRDIVVYTCYDKVYTFLNLGSGSFASAKTHTVSGGGGAIAAGDFNNDGFADITTNSGIQGYPEICLGKGDGTFFPPFTETSGRGVEALEVHDLNGDGELDIVAAYQLDGDGVSVLLGRPDGSFKPPLNYQGTYSGGTDNLTLGDVDGDGHVDVLVSDNSAQEISFWRGRGDGSLESQRRLGAGLATTSCAVRDFDGDGASDVMALVEPEGFGGWYYPAVTLLRGVPNPWEDLGQGLAGTHGVPALVGAGPATPAANAQGALDGALESAPAFLVVGISQLGLPLLGGVLVPTIDFILPLSTDAAGADLQTFHWPASQPSGAQLSFQTWIVDPGAIQGFAASNAVRATQP
jgi:hypothetical protein